MKYLLDIPYDTDLKFTSFDITNMHTNIPTNELSDIIRNLCTKNYVNLTTQTEIIRLCDVILTQNYLQFGSSYYLQKTGLATDAPTSSFFRKYIYNF